MTALALLFIVFLLVIRFRRDYPLGLGLSIFLLAALTHHFSIKLPGGLPSFTLHRIVLLCLLFFWLTNRRALGPALFPNPLFRKFVWVAIIGLTSTLLSVDLPFSIRTYLAFTAELFLFFGILSSSLRQPETAVTVLKYGYAGLLVTAVFGILEKKTGFNPVDAWLPGYVRNELVASDVVSTFPHRIHFGLGMAMAWPLAIGLSDFASGTKAKTAYLLSTVVILVACYFSDSRGPWMAALLAGVVLFLTASKGLKWRILLFMTLPLLALVLKPGVRETLGSKVSETRDKESFKGETYQYRWELWRVAFEAVRRSPKTLLLGTGLGTTEVTTFRTVLSYTGEEEEIWSWDNEYAATLVETGFLGLFAVLALHAASLLLLFRLWRASRPPYKNLMAAVLASSAGLFFMMTNVKMFSPQINYWTWTLVAAGMAIGAGSRLPTTEVPHDRS